VVGFHQLKKFTSYFLCLLSCDERELFFQYLVLTAKSMAAGDETTPLVDETTALTAETIEPKVRQPQVGFLVEVGAFHYPAPFCSFHLLG